MKCSNARRDACTLAKSAINVKVDVSNALMAKFVEATKATKENMAIIGTGLNDVLKQVSTQLEMMSQAVISRTRVMLECYDTDSLQKFGACLVVLHNRVTEVCRMQLETADPVVGFDA